MVRTLRAVLAMGTGAVLTVREQAIAGSNAAIAREVKRFIVTPMRLRAWRPGRAKVMDVTVRRQSGLSVRLGCSAGLRLMGSVYGSGPGIHFGGETRLGGFAASSHRTPPARTPGPSRVLPLPLRASSLIEVRASDGSCSSPFVGRTTLTGRGSWSGGPRDRVEAFYSILCAGEPRPVDVS